MRERSRLQVVIVDSGCEWGSGGETTVLVGAVYEFPVPRASLQPPGLGRPEPLEPGSRLRRVPQTSARPHTGLTHCPTATAHNWCGGGAWGRHAC